MSRLPWPSQPTHPSPTFRYRGVLACLDGYFHLAMEQTEE
jgi:hypothetical protein